MSRPSAYAAGLVDGADWDLSDFSSIEEAAAADGWDTATINALGSSACAAAWGVEEPEGPAWEAACDDYTRGVRAALVARGAPERCTECGHVQVGQRGQCRECGACSTVTGEVQS